MSLPPPNPDDLMKEVEQLLDIQFPPKSRSSYTIKQLANSCNKLLEQAELSSKLASNVAGEAETFKNLAKATLFYIEIVVRHPGYNSKDVAITDIRNKVYAAMAKLEDMKKDFKQRIANAQVQKAELDLRRSSLTPSTPTSSKAMIPAEKLITYLSQELVSLLILDVRAIDDFVQGHMGWMRPLWKLSYDSKSKLEGKVDLAKENVKPIGPPWERGCVVSIDPAWLIPPVSADFVLDRLRTHSLPSSPAPSCFERRKSYDVIIIYDERSQTPTENPALTILMRSLWDNPTIPPSQQLSRRPLILEGGWQQFLAVVRSQKKESLYVEVGDGWGGIGLDHKLMDKENKPNGVVKDVYEYIGGSRGPNSPNYTIGYDPPKSLQGPAVVPFKRNSSLNISTPQSPVPSKEQFNDRWGVGFDFDYSLPPEPVRPLLPSIPPKLLSNIPSVPLIPSAPPSIPSVSPTKVPPPIPPKPISLQPSAPPMDIVPIHPPITRASSPGAGQVFFTPPLSALSRQAPAIPPKPQTDHTSPEWSYSLLSSSSNMGMTGLKNLGNTCFMNSTVQCLSGTIPLARYFLDGSFRSSLNKTNSLGTGGQVTVAFSNLIREMWTGGTSFVSPIAFRGAVVAHAPQFRGNEQHDAQEFLAFLLDAIHEDLNQARVPGGTFPPPLTKAEEEREEQLPLAEQSKRAWDRYVGRNKSVIVKDFQGQLGSVVKCLTCGQTSITFNPFMYLTVPIPGSPLKRMFSSQTLTVYDCINKFLEEEKLTGSDKWQCTRCKQARESSKRLWLVKLPHILLVHLKRFYYQGPFRNKIDTFVDFPLRGLDLSSYVEAATPGQYVYDLFAVTNHEGGLNGGHYYSYIRNGYKNGQWFKFDDSRVAAMDENEVRSRGTGYILFYVRRS